MDDKSLDDFDSSIRLLVVRLGTYSAACLIFLLDISNKSFEVRYSRGAPSTTRSLLCRKYLDPLALYVRVIYYQSMVYAQMHLIFMHTGGLLIISIDH